MARKGLKALAALVRLRVLDRFFNRDAKGLITDMDQKKQMPPHNENISSGSNAFEDLTSHETTAAPSAGEEADHFMRARLTAQSLFKILRFPSTSGSRSTAGQTLCPIYINR